MNDEVSVICKRRCMTSYERQKLSKIANEWFSLFPRYSEEIIVVYDATVSTNTKETSQNSPGSIYKYSFITFRREAV